eukprot:3292399-Prymnesium_polylepis.1
MLNGAVYERDKAVRYDAPAAPGRQTGNGPAERTKSNTPTVRVAVVGVGLNDSLDPILQCTESGMCNAACSSISSWHMESDGPPRLDVSRALRHRAQRPGGQHDRLGGQPIERLELRRERGYAGASIGCSWQVQGLDEPPGEHATLCPSG